MTVVSESSDRGRPSPVPATPALRTRWDERARAHVLVVSGEGDPYTQEQFRAALARAAREGRVVVDLSEVTVLSGRAIGLLNRHRADLAAVLVAEDSLIARALSYSGFSRWVPVLAGRSASGGDADRAERDLPA